MSLKATPNLTGLVEARILSLIDNEEAAAFKGGGNVRSRTLY